MAKTIEAKVHTHKGTCLSPVLHLNIHSDRKKPDRPLRGRLPSGQNKCPICGKAYARPDNLRRHIRIEHEEHDAFRCQYCAAATSRKDNLDKHIRHAHDEVECNFEGCAWKHLAENFVQHLQDQHAEELGRRLYELAKRAYDGEEDGGEGGTREV